VYIVCSFAMLFHDGFILICDNYLF